jgi:RNA polymerase sigma factor (sigma-70 family)
MVFLPQLAPELELAELSDEALVELVQTESSAEAKSELLRRYHEPSQRLIGTLARQRGLGAADVEDSQQDAVFGIEKAIMRYDLGQVQQPHSCSFHTFVRRVLSDRFKDFTKHLWRVSRRHQSLPLAREAATGSAFDLDLPATPQMPDQNKTSDPAATAQWQELKCLVVKALDQLDSKERQLTEGVMSGDRLRTIAGELEMTYDATRSLWRKVRASLAALLRDQWG